MKMRSVIFLALSACISTMNSNAASEESQLIGVQRSNEKKTETVWVFGGRSIELPVTLLVKKESLQIVADLYLSGGSLGAPLAKSIALQSRGPSSFPGLREGDFLLDLPKVEKPTQLLLILREAAKESTTAQTIASIPLMVCPDSYLSQIGQQLATDANNGHASTLSIFGEMKGLRELLHTKQIPFEDAGRDLPSTITSGTIAVGEVPPDQTLPAPQVGPGSSLLIFHADTSSSAIITEAIQDRHMIVVVHQSPPTNWSDAVIPQQLLSRIVQKTPQSHE